MARITEDATQGLSIDPAREALMLSICFAAVYPVNVDGVDLEPHMIELPPEKQGFTDITLCLVTCFMINEVELSTHPLSTVASMQSREDCIKSVGATLHERYLNHFDLRIPFHWVFATIARLHLSKAWVSVHKQLSSSDPREPEPEYRGSALGWLCRSHKQKEAIVHILDELSTRPNGPETDRAWEIVTKTTSLWMQGPGAVGGVPEKPLLELIQRADMLREETLKGQNGLEMANLVGVPPLVEEEMISK
ncbi:uncharacterized protein N7477_006754 [Penicillium maclennaniae]|uniref:uncharacterized protein n=1 Tax=Penicillium maclennaniae TaxID=1343394 RepID=UPI002540CB6C|nr:uncharacterized protein N7477_006754 [Penicillium maclennaniae]KAJ5668184.1 hypothetical protein N7477_006754 [Penicillium maclennaniae]